MNWAGIDWDAISAIGQMLGALGVIVSLVYVGLQVRADARARRADTMHRQSEAFTTALHGMAHDGELSDIFVRGQAGLTALSAPEQFRLNMYLTGNMRLWADAYFQYRRKNLDPDVWETMQLGLRGVLSYPGLRAAWQTQAKSFPTEFRAFVETMIAGISVESTPPPRPSPAVETRGE